MSATEEILCLLIDATCGLLELAEEQFDHKDARILRVRDELEAAASLLQKE